MCIYIYIYIYMYIHIYIYIYICMLSGAAPRTRPVGRELSDQIRWGENLRRAGHHAKHKSNDCASHTACFDRLNMSEWMLKRLQCSENVFEHITVVLFV